MDGIDQLTSDIRTGRHLSVDETSRCFEQLMAGHLSDDQIEQFLVALADKGESVAELVGAATVLRNHVTRISCPAADAIDTCGTGGDGISTFNVSTAAAIVAAGAGATVAKHGNRTNSRVSGSAEVLAALGVSVEATPQVVERCLREAGIGFLFAPRLHPAMGKVAAIRRKLGRQTIFNLIGPLANPAFVKRQVIGVARVELMEKMAEALSALGAIHAFVVHGDDGLCDLTITGPSRFVEIREARISFGELTPHDLGLPTASLEDLRVKSPAESAAAILAILSGEPGPRRDHTLLNAAVALVAAGVAMHMEEAIAQAAHSIDSRSASHVLARLVEITNSDANQVASA